MTATDRLRNEQRFHDAQAAARACTFAAEPERLQFTNEEYLDHESWIRPAFARLGDVRGRRVLDWGCGHGMAAVVLARFGADVTACDLSGGYVSEARARATANGVAVRCVQADAQRTPFAAGSFDAIWGHAILHHLDVAAGAAELRRLLKPDGVAVLSEPWGGNPVLRAARRWLPYAGKEQTRDEQPLRAGDQGLLRQYFRTVEFEGFQLLSIARRILPTVRFRSWIDSSDAKILDRWPRLQRYGRYVVLTLRR